MRTSVLLLLLVAVPLYAISLQAMAAPQPAKKKPASTYVAQPKSPKSNPCAEYGAGFVRVDGSSTCIRVGGGIGVGTGVRR